MSIKSFVEKDIPTARMVTSRYLLSLIVALSGTLLVEFCRRRWWAVAPVALLWLVPLALPTHWTSQAADPLRVALLQGSAQLRFQDEPEPRQLHAGDWLWIAPHRRHRVEATDGGRGCLWLALFLPLNL